MMIGLSLPDGQDNRAVTCTDGLNSIVPVAVQRFSVRETEAVIVSCGNAHLNGRYCSDKRHGTGTAAAVMGHFKPVRIQLIGDFIQQSLLNFCRNITCEQSGKIFVIQPQNKGIVIDRYASEILIGMQERNP